MNALEHLENIIDGKSDVLVCLACGATGRVVARLPGTTHLRGPRGTTCIRCGHMFAESGRNFTKAELEFIRNRPDADAIKAYQESIVARLIG